MDSNSIFENKNDDDFLLFGEDDKETDDKNDNQKIDEQPDVIENIAAPDVIYEKKIQVNKLENAGNGEDIFNTGTDLKNISNNSDVENSILGDNPIQSNGVEKNIIEETLLNNDSLNSDVPELDSIGNIDNDILDVQIQKNINTPVENVNDIVDLNKNIEEPVLDELKINDKTSELEGENEKQDGVNINIQNNELTDLGKDLDEEELNIGNIDQEEKSNLENKPNEDVTSEEEISNISKNIMENIENLNLDNLNSDQQQENTQDNNIEEETTAQETSANESKQQDSQQQPEAIEPSAEEQNITVESPIVQEEQKQETKTESINDIIAPSTTVENDQQNSEELKNKTDVAEKEFDDTGEFGEKAGDECGFGVGEDSGFKLSDDVLNDLEAVNDDFAAEIKAEKEKELEEARKNSGQDKDDKEEELNLKPIEAEEKLSDIINLNLGNIEEFLKNNGKSYCDLKEKKENLDEIAHRDDNVEENKEEKTQKQEEITQALDNSEQNIPADSILNNFKLNNDLWDELHMSEELQNKVTKRVKIEIKSFIKDNVIPLLEKITK